MLTLIYWGKLMKKSLNNPIFSYKRTHSNTEVRSAPYFFLSFLYLKEIWRSHGFSICKFFHIKKATLAHMHCVLHSQATNKSANQLTNFYRFIQTIHIIDNVKMDFRFLLCNRKAEKKTTSKHRIIEQLQGSHININKMKKRKRNESTMNQSHVHHCSSVCLCYNWKDNESHDDAKILWYCDRGFNVMMTLKHDFKWLQ